MRMLSNARNSFYFWPIVTLSAVAVFFFGWAVQISSQNWAGQAVWGGFATIIVLVLAAMAVRDSHRASVSRLASTHRLGGIAPK